MKITTRLEQLHYRARSNKWLGYFSIFCRVVLAAGFIPSGMVKILGERFTDLHNNHPMGQYLEALFHTGYYYTFVGIMQVTAAILLLIPRTATLGAVIYFPIILNIFLLSYAVRFDGSLFTSPLMVLANLFLLCWDYHKIKYIFPFYHKAAKESLPPTQDLNRKFPWLFFSGVAATFLIVVLVIPFSFDLFPRNTIEDCLTQCQNMEDPADCHNFCECIHLEGQSLDKCLEAYEKDSLPGY